LFVGLYRRNSASVRFRLESHTARLTALAELYAWSVHDRHARACGRFSRLNDTARPDVQM